jgi:hypothetical protein
VGVEKNIFLILHYTLILSKNIMAFLPKALGLGITLNLKGEDQKKMIF